MRIKRRRRTMSRKIILLALICFLSLIINSCAVRTYKITKQRVDQDLSSGNRGILFGEGAVSEEEPRRATRQIQVIEFDLPGKGTKEARVAAVEPGLGVSESEPEEVVIEEAEEPTVVISPAEPTKVMTMKKYTVLKGDTLQKISKKFYGTTRRWNEIYKANQAMLKAPDNIYPGQVIEIPIEEVKGTK
jgi:LysM repeat protein